MRTLSNLWTMLVERDTTRLETVAVINGVEYSTITAPVANHSLLSGDMLTVGNCIASTLSFTVMTTNTIPKSAKVVIKCRLVDGQVYTSWYEFGTFYISKREVDDDLVTLECYDAMLKGNQAYGGSSDALNWPKAMTTVVNTIASRMGLQLDSRTVINSNSSVYKCEYPGEKTLLEVLGYIGACHGGNWIITPENKLRLVPLTGSGNTVDVPVVIEQFTTADGYTISGVTMSIDDDNVYTAGDSSGYMLTIDQNPYANQTIVNNLYNTLKGLKYQPFHIAGAIYNPAAELGDTIVIGDIKSVLISETRSYDIAFRAIAEAPAKDEAEDEYPYPSAIKRLQKSILASNGEIYSKIEQTQSNIMLEVGKKVDKDGIVAQINLGLEKDGSGSFVKISADYLNLSGYAKFTDLSNENSYTIINGSNIKTGTIDADRISSSVIQSISTAQDTAEAANSRQQYIYCSKASGTATLSATTTWVTDATGSQNKWTTKRPEYNKSYPVLFIAMQSQTVKQKKAGSTCDCTTPAIDKTTTTIDGGNIITYSITADQIAAHTITAAEIAAGTITADEIAADTITVDKLTGSITNGGWELNFKKGTFTIGEISADKITAGTLDASKVTVSSSNLLGKSLYLVGAGINFGGKSNPNAYIRYGSDSDALDSVLRVSSSYQILVASSVSSDNGNVDGLTLRGRQLCISTGTLVLSNYGGTSRYATYTGTINYTDSSGNSATLHVRNGIITTT